MLPWATMKYKKMPKLQYFHTKYNGPLNNDTFTIYGSFILHAHPRIMGTVYNCTKANYIKLVRLSRNTLIGILLLISWTGKKK